MMKIKRLLNRIITAVLSVFLLSSCGNIGIIPYRPDLGYDLSGYRSAVIRIYHPAAKDHIWELLEEYTYAPSGGLYLEIAGKGAEGKLDILLKESDADVNDNITVILSSQELCRYSFEINGFDGTAWGFQRYELLRKEEEQNLMLIAAGKDGSTVFGEVSLKSPYDALGTNLENILITATLQK